VYAASSSTYGDHPALPKREESIGKPLSPYAVTKYVNELYAGVFNRVYGVETVGLRYFNVFGARQDPAGAYAAVIPRWIEALQAGDPCIINGDGATSRDFCFVGNVVYANLSAAMAPTVGAFPVYNIAAGQQTTLVDLYRLLRDKLAAILPDDGSLAAAEPQWAPERAGDVRHSLADIGKAERELGYRARYTLSSGLDVALPWYVASRRERLRVGV